MNPEILVSAIATGIIGSAAILLPTIAIALVYQHGRYIPIWLPDLGLLGAYITHSLWSNLTSYGAIAITLAILVCAGFAILFHIFLFQPFLRNGDLLSPLLIGVGLSQIFQAIAGIYGAGMSQHYPDNLLQEQVFVDFLGVSFYRIDFGFIILTFITLSILFWFLRSTHLGLQTRAVISNPDFSASLGLPVKYVAVLVICFSVTLLVVGTVLRGIRYDLQPAMMVYPGLTAITACIVATRGRLVLAIAVVTVMEILTALAGVYTVAAPFQRAIPFILLLLYLLVRAWLSVHSSPKLKLSA